MFGSEGVRKITPAPVSGRPPGHIHPCFAAETKYILERRKGQVGDRAHDLPDHGPVDALVFKTEIRAGKLMFLLDVFGTARGVPDAARPPADDSVVVVHAGIRGQVARVIVRPERRTLRIVPEGELQDGHARKSELVANSF